MTPFDMNYENAIKLISKVKSGEYHYSNLKQMFMSVCQKSWKRYDELLDEWTLTSDGSFAFDVFEKYIDEAKFGLEYKTNGKVRYIGTNDIRTFVIA